jgi:hypothetical protein
MITTTDLIFASFMNERWFHNNYTATHFKISRQYIIQAEAAMWTLFSQCELPLRPQVGVIRIILPRDATVPVAEQVSL